MPEIAWRIQAPGPFCPCRCHIARRKLVICRQRLCQSILMITNGLTPVFGSEPLSWGTFGVLFDPPRFGLFILSLPLDDALETHACLLQNTSWMLFCRLPSRRLDVILSRLAPFCLFRGHKAYVVMVYFAAIDAPKGVDPKGVDMLSRLIRRQGFLGMCVRWAASSS